MEAASKMLSPRGLPRQPGSMRLAAVSSYKHPPSMRQQLRLATALREADSPAILRSATYCFALAITSANAPSNVVNCRRRVREEPILE